LHASRCRGDEAAPFSEVTGQLHAGVFFAVGRLGDHVPQHTAERSVSPPVVELYMVRDSLASTAEDAPTERGRSLRHDLVVLRRAFGGLRGRLPRRATGLSVAIIEAHNWGGFV